MAITQRFYPNFFMNAMLDNLAATGNVAAGFTIACKAQLHTTVNGSWDVADNTTADMTPVTTQSDGSAITNPTFNVTVARNGSAVEFDVPSMQWTNPNTFQHITISTNTNPSYLMMNLDIGTSVSSGGTVTLTMNSGAKPALEFTT